MSAVSTTPAPTTRLAYLISRYPAVTHAFILEEVRALRAAGVDVEPVAVQRARPEDLLSPSDREEYERTHALRPTTPARVAADHARAFAQAPLAYMGTLARALRLSSGGARAVLWQLFYFAEAILLWAWMDERRLRHVHVHFANPASDVAMLAVAFGDRAGTGGDRWTWSFTAHGPSELRDPVRNRLAAKVSAASAVVCTSDFTRSQLAIAAPSQWEKLRTVRCGVDLDVFARDGRPPAAGDGLRILNVAGMRPQKGQAVLLEALAILRRDGVDASLVIVGDGPERSQLEARVAELGLEEHAVLAGAVGHDTIPRYMREADVFCLPSFAEGLPTVLLESMASGLPVVATYVAGIPELVEDGRSGLLVPAGRADLLAGALARLAGDPALRDELARAAREQVAARYELRRQVDELRDVLAAVAAR